MSGRADGLDDIFDNNVTVKKNLDVNSGTITKTPTKDNDIVDKEYVDGLHGKIPVVAANPATADDGCMILNSTNHSIYIWYSGDWRLLHTITITEEYILLENGGYLLQENGDLIII